MDAFLWDAHFIGDVSLIDAPICQDEIVYFVNHLSWYDTVMVRPDRGSFYRIVFNIIDIPLYVTFGNL